MKITNVAINYRTTVLVLTLLLAFGGLVSYVTIPKESFPSIEIPNIVVTTVYPGASPDDIESVITQPIEQEIQGINGIKEIRSTSTEGVSSIVVEFTPDVSMDDAFQKVRDKVDVAKAELPSDVEEPIVSEIDLQEFPIMSINMSAPYSLARLKEVGEDLADELETITSVLEVDVIGGLEREVQINVDLNALQGYNISFNDIVSAIQQENTNLPGGSVDVDRLNYLVRVNGEFDNPEEEIANLVVTRPEGGEPIYVRDVADVIFGYKDRSSYARLRVIQVEEDDELRMLPEEETATLQVVNLNVKKRSGANILETSDEVNAKLAAFAFPAGTNVIITGDQSEQVNILVKDLENNIISGLIFVIAVLLFFLGVRNATLVGIAIPLSMFISFMLFQIAGQTLNFVMLFSFIIALGMLVDNAIVIVENIYRYREEGYSKIEAAKQGTAEVGLAVVASTATTVAAFAPMLFWPGQIGQFMSYMPLTLIVTLSSSLFVAIIINPVITGIFVKLETEESAPKPRFVRLITTLLIVVVGVVLLVANWKTFVVLAVGIPLLYFAHTRVFKPIGDRFVQTTLPNLVKQYRHFLEWMLKRDYSLKASVFANWQPWAISGVLVLIGGMMLGAVMNPEAPPHGDEPLGQALMMGGILIAGAGVVFLLLRIKDSLFRNTFALGALSLGAVIAIAGAIVGAMAGEAASYILLIPGQILLLVGVLGMIFHMFENFFMGGRTTVKAGVVFGIVVVVIIGLLFLVKGSLNPNAIGGLLTLPLLIIVAGLSGMFFNANGQRKPLLTDNRARLITSTLGVFFVVIFSFASAPTGVEFFPNTDPNQIRVTLEAPLGTNIETSDRIAAEAQRRIDQLIADNPEVRANVQEILTNVGVSADADFGGGASSPERSRITLNLVAFEDRVEPSSETMRKFREQLQGIPGVDMDFGQDAAGPPTGAPVNIEVSGPDFATITRITTEIREMLTEASETGAIPGLVDVNDNLNTGRPELRVEIDRERAARFGLNTFMIAQSVRSAINGAEAGKFRTGEDEYDIMVRLTEGDRGTLESVENLTIFDEGQQIPITAVANFDVAGGLGSVTRLDLQRVATVVGDAAPGFNSQAILGQVQGYLADYPLPPGYTLAYTGENEEQNESFGFLGIALGIGLALIIMIMIAQFNKVSLPFIIMIAVGLSFLGVLLGLMLTQTAFGLMTFIGVISLAGIVVNNNIVLVDYIMQLRDRGMDKQHAIIEGGATRLRPVLLTALTTVIGLVPLTFGINVDFVGLLTDWSPNLQFGSENTQFWGPMGTTIIAGLIFATFLTLVIVPVMYSTFDSVSGRLSKAMSASANGEQAVVPTTTNGTPTVTTPAAVINGKGGDGATETPAVSKPETK